MTLCAYCGQRATEEIPSIPSNVCLAHVIEFWTGLLAYVKDRSDAFQTFEPDVYPPVMLAVERASDRVKQFELPTQARMRRPRWTKSFPSAAAAARPTTNALWTAPRRGLVAVKS
jgi:hypothetical protein